MRQQTTGSQAGTDAVEDLVEGCTPELFIKPMTFRLGSLLQALADSL
jgi:hypothetical protein